MPFPLAISGISSLASVALDAWKRTTESQAAAATTQPQVDFQTLLNSASIGNGSSTGGFQQGVAALPEIKAALASAGTGTPVQITVSPDGTVSQTLPGGVKQSIPLSESSQALVHQWTTANPGSSLSVALVA